MLLVREGFVHIDRRLQELLLRSDAIQLLDLTNCAALRHLALPALQPGNTAAATGPLPPVRRSPDWRSH